MRVKDLPRLIFTTRRYVRRRVNDTLYYRTHIETFSFTLSKITARRLRRVAAAKGMRLSPFIRASALAYLENRYLVPVQMERTLDGIHRAMLKIESDLAVIAKKARRGERPTTPDLSNAAQLVGYLWDGLNHFVRNPPRADGDQESQPETGQLR